MGDTDTLMTALILPSFAFTFKRSLWSLNSAILECKDLVIPALQIFLTLQQGSDWRIEGTWCKIDKPDLVLDLEAFKKAYSLLGADLGGVKLL